jgi:uncharacterized protein
MSIETTYLGPKRGADRAVLLAHGAGTGMTARDLTVFAGALADAGIPTMRFNFPYIASGRRSPDRPPVLEATVREAAFELAQRAKVPPERIVLGGRSMGGRICSMVVGDREDPLPALGLALLAYPLHPPGKVDRLRVEHFPRIGVPCLFVSGTRDAFGSPDELRQHAKAIAGTVHWHWIESADHSFKPLKASGITFDAALEAAAAATVTFVTDFP